MSHTTAHRDVTALQGIAHIESARVGRNRRATFNALCRIKGTRCDRIMAAVVEGLPDAEIARRFYTDTETIRVYRQALRDELPDKEMGGTRSYDIDSIRFKSHIGRPKGSAAAKAEPLKSAQHVAAMEKANAVSE